MDEPDTSPLLPEQAASIVADLLRNRPGLDAQALARRLAEAAVRLRPRFTVAATRGKVLAAALLATKDVPPDVKSADAASRRSSPPTARQNKRQGTPGAAGPLYRPKPR